MMDEACYHLYVKDEDFDDFVSYAIKNHKNAYDYYFAINDIRKKLKFTVLSFQKSMLVTMKKKLHYVQFIIILVFLKVTLKLHFTIVKN